MDAFPGFTMRIHEIFARDDKVACYLIFEGVQTREFLGHPASGRKVRFSLMFMITLKDGKYIEKRAHYNTADILRQLSAGVATHCPVCIITGRAAYLTGAMSLAWKGNPLTPGLLFIPIQALYKGLECGISVKDCTLSHLPFHGYLVS